MDYPIAGKSFAFSDYHAARDYAQKVANATGWDVAVRKVKEYGKWRLNLSYASRNDSDYARAEIVSPARRK